MTHPAPSRPIPPHPAPASPSPSVARAIPLSIDRSLNLSVGVQLRGQLEYGIAGGEIERGARLPSVRELAQELGLAHMTVVQVYKDLLGQGLIVTRPGRGTFVADAPQLGAQSLELLRELMGDTLERAGKAGYSPQQVSEVLNVLLARGTQERGTQKVHSRRGGVQVLLVGIFMDATGAYAQTLQDALPAGDQVRFVTLEALRREGGLEQTKRVDVVLALAHRVLETQALLPGVGVLPLNFIPSETTRQALAALSPLTRLAVVATFEEFLPTFLAGVRRFAPHLSELRATHIHSPDLPELLGWAEATVYATGSEMVRTLAGDSPSFEYRHTIDPRDIERVVLPAVNAVRSLTP